MRTHARHVSLALAAVLAVAAVGCKKRTFNAQVKEAQAPVMDDAAKTDLTPKELLEIAPAIANAGVPYTAKWEVFAGITNENQKRHAKIYFGPIKKDQCDTLKALFDKGHAAGSSAVDCDRKVDLPAGDPDAKFNGHVAGTDGKPIHFLVDHFLPPSMQATMKHSFAAEADETQRAPTQDELKKHGAKPQDGWVTIEGVYLDTNCWATAYEVARFEKPNAAGEVDYDIHVIPPELMLALLDKKKLDANKAPVLDTKGKPVPEFAFNRAGGAIPKDKLEAWMKASPEAGFGDLLVILGPDDANPGKKTIAHAAVFVDKGLVFERVGNAEPNLPFRLASLRDNIAAYSGAEYEFHVYKILKPFPAVADTKALDSETAAEGAIFKTDQRVEDLTLKANAQGYFKLPPNAFQKGVQQKQD